MAQEQWMIKGAEYANCNCAFGCPCQFNALPTHGNCQYVLFTRIDEGHYGDVDLSGLVFAFSGAFPGAVHEGNGKQQLHISDRASDAQHEAIRRIVYNEDTEEMNTHYAIYNAMSSTVYDAQAAPIELEMDIEGRRARGSVGDIITSTGQPILNPVTGEEHRARINLPEGFEYTVAEMGSASSRIGGNLDIELNDSYAQFNELHVNQDGVIR